MDPILEFISAIRNSFEGENFVKITCSKSIPKSNDLKNIYIRKVLIKGEFMLSFNYRYQAKDQVKNYSLENGLIEIEQLFNNPFKIVTLFDLNKDTIITFNKKGKGNIRTNGASFSDIPDFGHDREKVKRTEQDATYLQLLGVSDHEGVVIPKMADKYRQINKYLEILEGLISEQKYKRKITIVDMGSGKGYLTFALHDFLSKKGWFDFEITGIELREDMVTKCNSVAKELGAENIKFVKQRVEDFKGRIDVLIALHACDTATDDAIHKGITADSSLIICAPCCHKQVRKDMKDDGSNPIIEHGIFKERQCEMITDTLRALLLEQKGYKTKVFEFISNEHTRKNVMLVASADGRESSDDNVQLKIDSIKKQYGLKEQYLEGLLR